jgi:adenylate cyclase
MNSAWQGTVLLADVRAKELFATVGANRALREVAQCVDVMEKAALGRGGQVVRTKGDELMVLFPGPEPAAEAAAAMQAAVDALPPVAQTKLGVRIAFHQGAPAARGRDVLGDTVKLASRLLQQAHNAQIVTTRNTAAQLSPDFSGRMRALSAGTPKIKVTEAVKTEALQLYELVWRRESRGLLLKYGASTVRRSPEDPSAVRLGRDFESDVVVLDDLASRQHCTIALRAEGFVLEDHSSNGTYVTEAGETEVALRHASRVLRRQGVIAFGHPRTSTTQLVEYHCIVRS